GRGRGGRREGLWPRGRRDRGAGAGGRAAVGPLQDRRPLVPPAAVGLLEGVRRRRVCRRRLRGAPGHRGPLPPRREREEAPEQQDTALFGGLQTAKDSPDGIT